VAYCKYQFKSSGRFEVPFLTLTQPLPYINDSVRS